MSTFKITNLARAKDEKCESPLNKHTLNFTLYRFPLRAHKDAETELKIPPVNNLAFNAACESGVIFCFVSAAVVMNQILK